MKSAYDSRGVRFDVYAEAKNGRIYDVEIQTLPHKDLAKRTRYYHDVIDSYITKPGVLFSELSAPSKGCDSKQVETLPGKDEATSPATNPVQAEVILNVKRGK